MSGVGFGLVFNPSTSIIAVYFNKYKNIATAITTCGTGVGSFIFPPIIKALEDAYGWRGAFLILSGIYANVLVFCCLYRPVQQTNGSKEFKRECLKVSTEQVSLRERCSDKEKELLTHLNGEDTKTCQSKHGKCQNEDKTMNGFADVRLDGDIQEVQIVSCANGVESRNVFTKSLSLFKSLPFVCLCLHTMLTLFPTVLVYTHFGNYVLSLQFSKQDVVLLYMAIGITTTIARLLTGICIEMTKANPVVVVSLSAIINGLITTALPFTGDLGVLYLYAVVFAVMLSPYNALCLPLTMASVPLLQVATAYGIVCFFCVPGTALGAPLAGRSAFMCLLK